MFAKKIDQSLNISKRVFIGPLLCFLFKKFGISARYRFLNTNSAAIGHLCADVDCFIKEKKLEKFDFRGILLSDQRKCANNDIARLWSNHKDLIVITNPFLCFLLDYLRIYPETGYDCSKYVALDFSPAEVFNIYNKYNSNVPVIEWDAPSLKRAEKLFKAVFPNVEKDRIAVLHSRDSTFDSKTKNPNLFTQNYRSSDIRSFNAILDYLHDRSFTTIRIGEYQGNEVEGPKRYLELPDLDIADTELLNVYLTSQCTLFIGSASGASQLATIWGRPIFLVNILPYSFLRPHPKNSMAIPKLLLEKNRVVSALEIFSKKYHWYRNDSDYKSAHLETLSADPNDCIDDFDEFFRAFVEHDQKLLNDLKTSKQQVMYSELCPQDAYDYYAESLIPRHYFQKFSLL
ncbi:MAG: TIGR04372 family glycosyltransferase [Rhodobacteraceae bacterium]|nr:TIGR04372 family glycosyltransferase [Paracoccaceae bacterium]